MVRTIHMPLHNKQGRIVHTATIRSDWTTSDYDLLKKMFPGTDFRTVRVRYPIDFINKKHHHTDFSSLYRKELI